MPTKVLSTRWLSQAQAADYLSVTDRTIRSYIAAGHLPAHRVRGSRLIRVSRSDLDAMLSPIPTVTGGGADAA